MFDSKDPFETMNDGWKIENESKLTIVFSRIMFIHKTPSYAMQ